ALQPGLPGNRRLQAGPVLGQRLPELLVRLGLLVGRVVDDGVPQVGLDLDADDGEEPEAVVVQPLHLLGDDLLDEVVQARRARVVACGPRSIHGSASSIQSRLTLRTSTSGDDQTKRSTSSSSPTRCPWLEATAATPTVARCQSPWLSISDTETRCRLN